MLTKACLLSNGTKLKANISHLIVCLPSWMLNAFGTDTIRTGTQLHFNPYKVQHICVGQKAYESIKSFLINDAEIKCVDSVSLLGVNKILILVVQKFARKQESNHY